MDKPAICIITPFFSPNIGGVETHLDDLTAALDAGGYRVYVQTLSPLTTTGVPWLPRETRGRVSIRRYRWFGRNLFHRLESYPLLDFLYMAPYLFLRTFFFLSVHHRKVDVLHAQGLNAALAGLILKKIFRKKLIVSIHAIYELSPSSKTARLAKTILSGADKVLTLSRASANEWRSLGVDENKIQTFRYWIDLDIFRPLDRPEAARTKLGLPAGFLVLFVGRLIRKKGVEELVTAAQRFNDVSFLFIGDGPLAGYLREKQARFRNIIFAAAVANKNLVDYYNSANAFCIPSQYEEGFGRVAMEAVACGLPVIGTNKGGVPEALDGTVALLVEPTVENLEISVRRLREDTSLYQRLKANCRPYAQKHFGIDNANGITRYYSEAS